jgi:hypothetical protein
MSAYSRGCAVPADTFQGGSGTCVPLRGLGRYLDDILPDWATAIMPLGVESGAVLVGRWLRLLAHPNVAVRRYPRLESWSRVPPNC